MLKSAATSGIKNYRLGWFNSSFKFSVLESVFKYKDFIEEINDLNKRNNTYLTARDFFGMLIANLLHEFFLSRMQLVHVTID